MEDKTTLQEKTRQIKLLILDADGILTDSELYYSPHEEILKVFHMHDGLGIKQLKTNIEIAIISGRNRKAISKRATALLRYSEYIRAQYNKLIAV